MAREAENGDPAFFSHVSQPMMSMDLQELALLLLGGVGRNEREGLLSLQAQGKTKLVHERICAHSTELSQAFNELLVDARLPTLLERQAAGELRLLRLCDTDYPRLLRETADPPALLFARGRLELLEREAVAIVGTRAATGEGTELARQLARTLVGAGLLVVSGAARGIDHAAHLGAGNADTCAVLGPGFDHPYPWRHRELLKRIGKEGLLLSEQPPWSETRAWQFPRRNRIVAGLCRAVVVVQAPLRSGALITARLALEENREVLACPGGAADPHFEGCHRLIREGARLVCSAEDLLEDLSSLPLGLVSRDTKPVEDGVIQRLAALSPYLRELAFALRQPRWRDELLAGREAGELASGLMELEMAGLVTRLPGDRWRLRTP